MKVIRAGGLAVTLGLLAACTDTLTKVGEGVDETLVALGGGFDDDRASIKAVEAALASPKPNAAVRALKVIRAIPHEESPELTDYLEEHAYRMPPVVLYELSARVYPHDRWRGVYWYFAARVRYTYDLMRCVDYTVMDRLKGADRFANGPVTEIRLNPKASFAIAMTALRWDRENPLHKESPLGECASGESYQFAHGVEARIMTPWPFDSPYLVMETPPTLYADEWIRPTYEHGAILDQARGRVQALVDALAETPGILPEAWHD